MRIVRPSTILIATLGLMTGCATSSKGPTEKQLVQQRWSDARAGVLIGLATDQYKNASFDRARVTIDEAMRLSPQNAPAYLLSAKLYIETGQLEAAERELIVTRQLAPTDPEAEYLSGVVYQRWQQPDRALEFYQHACDKAPAELAYLLAKSEMLVAMDRRPEALAILQQRVTYFEHSGAIRDEIGLLMMQEGRYPQAVEMLRRASILATDDFTIREHLASALYFDKQYSDCAHTLDEILKDAHYAKRADLLMMLGECQVQIGRADEAEQAFQTACELLPSSPDAWLSVAKVELQLGHLTVAERALNRGLALDTNNSQAYLLFGYLRLEQSKYQDALDLFTRAHQLDPNDTVSLCMIGLSLEKLGHKDRASGWFVQALKISPADEMATQLMTQLDSHE
jgi:tetratricopeptide (TPR) repeat protein